MAAVKELSIEDKLKALHELQSIDCKIDEINTLRGELPIEVDDLEDEIAGLETRFSKIEDEIASLEEDLAIRRNSIKDSEKLIARYKEHQDNVKNSREFDALSKEVEMQTLEIQLSEKKIREGLVSI